MTIINVLIILWTVIILPVSQRIYHRVFNPCFLTCVIWCLCSTLSTTGAFSFVVPSQKTYICILIFILALSICLCVFHLGFEKLFVHRITKSAQNEYGSCLAPKDEMTINVKLFALILALFVLFLSPILVKSIGYIASGDFFTLREMILRDAESYMGRYPNFIYNYIIRPYIVFLDILAAYAFGKSHRQKWKILAVALVGSTLHMVLTAGRMLYFELLCYIFLAILLYRPKKSDIIARFSFWRLHINMSKRGFVILIITIPLIIGMIFMTLNRMNSKLGILGSIWQYSIGPMSYFDILVNNPKLFGIQSGNYMLGQATLGPLFSFMESLKSALFGTDYAGPDYILSLYSEVYYTVAPGVKMNATPTILYPFLRDWGVIGLLIGPIIVSIFVEFIYYKAEHNRNTSWNLSLIMIYYMLLFSIWRYTLINPWSYMVFFWIFAFGFLNNIKFRISFNGVRNKVSLKTNMTSPDKRNTVMVRK